MKAVGIVGWHNSGKTTLLVALVRELTGRGLRVSTVKHAHHRFDVDTPGKDSWEHRAAGATEVMVGSERRWALMHELRDEPEPDLDALLAKMSPVDIVLVEGFKSSPLDKIEVYRDGLDEPPVAASARDVVAIVCETAIENVAGTVRRLDPRDVPAIADFILTHWQVAAPSGPRASERA